MCSGPSGCQVGLALHHLLHPLQSWASVAAFKPITQRRTRSKGNQGRPGEGGRWDFWGCTGRCGSLGRGKQRAKDLCREGYEEGSRGRSVEGIIGKQIGFDKFGELEVMQFFKGEMREYPANYEIIRGTIQEQAGEVEWSQNTRPAGDL